MPAPSTTIFSQKRVAPCGNVLLLPQGILVSDNYGSSSPNDPKVPSSLAYHLADIYLEELDRVLGDPPSPPPAPLSTLLSPFFILSARTQNNTTFQRIQSALLDPLLVSLSPTRDDEPPTPKRQRLSSPSYDNLVTNSCSIDPKTEGAVEKAPLKKLLLRRIFDIASEHDTRDSNRRKLYAIWRAHVEEEGAEERPVDAS